MMLMWINRNFFLLWFRVAGIPNWW